jgi:hypothetical protein
LANVEMYMDLKNCLHFPLFIYPISSELFLNHAVYYFSFESN